MVELPHVVVLASGRGRNFEALVAAHQAGELGPCRLSLVCNVADAPVLDRARQAGVPAQLVPHRDYRCRADFDAALQATLVAASPDLVVLAGFMRILGTGPVEALSGRMINIHPSLLPRHPGLHTHRQVIASGDREHGASVHFVTAELDGGPVIIQGRVSVQPEDTPESLADRVMSDVEIHILPRCVRWFLTGELALDNGQVRLHGALLDTPVQLQNLKDPTE